MLDHHGKQNQKIKIEGELSMSKKKHAPVPKS
jgi:hypothetical protein